MSREWKPGDVAMVTFYAQGLPVSTVGVRTTYEKVGADVWWTSRGWIGDHSAKFVRPLVVIDPEDREAVERLQDLFADERDRNGGQSRLVVGGWADAMQAALREYANPKPPKPDEPQGLGAVVEDDGEVWVRTEPQGAGWCPSGATSSQEYRCWADFSTAVRVLSPGVEIEVRS